jgi:hypothetical protein
MGFPKNLSGNVIFNILRIFCVLNDKGITPTQDLIHDIFFESDLQEVILDFEFKRYDFNSLFLS